MKEILVQSRHGLEWLKFNQRQLDADGIEVAVSRQALNEVLTALETAIDVVPDILAALKVAYPWIETSAEGEKATKVVLSAIAKAEGRGNG